MHDIAAAVGSIPIKQGGMGRLSVNFSVPGDGNPSMNLRGGRSPLEDLWRFRLGEGGRTGKQRNDKEQPRQPSRQNCHDEQGFD
jgi:hypothetical protein